MNPEGRAICMHCGAPLTRYADDVTGRVSAETREKARQASLRPRAVPAAAALAALWALFGPLAYAIGALRGRPTTNAEGTNYIWAAVGAVVATIDLAAAIPLAIALVVLAWGVWTQRTWAWYCAAGAIVVDVLVATHTLGASPFVAVLRGAVGIALGIAWYRPTVREWYGVGRSG